MAIPDHAEKVFEGIIFDVYHWEQEQFDGTFRTFEGLRHLNNVIIVPIVDGKIYFHKEEQPANPINISLPAGRFDRGETDPVAVAARELLEETGYASDDFELFRTNERSIGQMEWTSFVVIARNCHKVQEPKLDAGERVHERYLLDFDEALVLTQHPDFRGGALGEDWQKANTDPVFREEFRKKIFGVY
jgi:ADP-ribose pyrophosphatase